ncbi:SRPBCC family protein [Rhodococcus sp. USK13]|uniref:SRPBCC family protein n=1 Tax=Rhodococcus sp. USK13 TaxID=2806442 RepID=UPI001BCF3940|nr:SRPBCC family protein [Rhodococcus sp. USK13]
MIEVSKTLAVNTPDTADLTVDDLWDGLVMKAENPLPFVPAITACTVTDRFDGGLVREIVLGGETVREVVTLYPQRRVHFVRTHGAAKGTIDNEIEFAEDGNLLLTFTFRIVLDGVEAGSAAEAEFAERMEADYLSAVATTLDAVRSRSAQIA